MFCLFHYCRSWLRPAFIIRIGIRVSQHTNLAGFRSKTPLFFFTCFCKIYFNNVCLLVQRGEWAATTDPHHTPRQGTGCGFFLHFFRHLSGKNWKQLLKCVLCNLIESISNFQFKEKYRKKKVISLLYFYHDYIKFSIK